MSSEQRKKEILSNERRMHFNRSRLFFHRDSLLSLYEKLHSDRRWRLRRKLTLLTKKWSWLLLRSKRPDQLWPVWEEEGSPIPSVHLLSPSCLSDWCQLFRVSQLTSPFRFHTLRTLSSSSTTNHRSTLRWSMRHQLAHTSISIHRRCCGTSCCYSVDDSSPSGTVGEILFCQSDCSVWSLRNLHCGASSASFSLRLADRWLRLDLRCKEPRSMFWRDPIELLSSNPVSSGSLVSASVYTLSDLLLLLFVLSNKDASGCEETRSCCSCAKIWALDSRDSICFQFSVSLFDIRSWLRSLTLVNRERWIHILPLFQQKNGTKTKESLFDSSNQRYLQKKEGEGHEHSTTICIHVLEDRRFYHRRSFHFDIFVQKIIN